MRGVAASVCGSITSIVRIVSDRPDPGGVRANLAGTTRTSWRLSEHLESLITERVTPEPGPSGGKRKPSSKPPWNSAAADLVFDLRSLARHLEDDLRSRVTGGTVRRGWSDRNTELSLQAITDLSVVAVDSDVAVVLVKLTSWVERARPVVGETEPLRRVPRVHGYVEPRCPWCGYCTLRCKLAAGLVFCINPSCTDQSGRRPQGTVEVGTTVEDVTLRWQDSTCGVPQYTVQEVHGVAA
jgi:hypothetical protein